jgi:hypothetical protein
VEFKVRSSSIYDVFQVSFSLFCLDPSSGVVGSGRFEGSAEYMGKKINTLNENYFLRSANFQLPRYLK